MGEVGVSLTCSYIINDAARTRSLHPLPYRTSCTTLLTLPSTILNLHQDCAVVYRERVVRQLTFDRSVFRYVRFSILHYQSCEIILLA